MDINRLIQPNERLIQLNQSNEPVTPLMRILNIINSPIIISNPNNILNRSFEEQEIQKHPTEKNFIDSLEKIEFNEDQKEIYCGICLDNFKNGDKAYILPCKDKNQISLYCVAFILEELNPSNLEAVKKEFVKYFDITFFPKKFFHIKEFPKTKTGKIDRKSLEERAKILLKINS